VPRHNDEARRPHPIESVKAPVPGAPVEGSAGLKIINTEGMAFLGPGSEWFWAMVQALIIGFTLVFIFQQLHAMKLANALGEMRKLTERWESMSMVQARLSVAVDLRVTRPTSP
jgi:hypothetical protein